METTDVHVERIKLAEQQFRLACTVHLAVTNQVQTLDVPVEWSFGEHRVSYEDFGLRADQAPLAAAGLEHSSMSVLISALRDAIVREFENPKTHNDPRVTAAYQISRIIRNAFAHSAVAPVWSIDADCKDKVFAIEGVLSLDTSGLNGQPLRWPHYGGPLAIFNFGRFVRETLLGNPVDPNRAKPPYPSLDCYQMGRLVLRRVDELPSRLVEVARAGPGESIDLGDGYRMTMTAPLDGDER